MIQTSETPLRPGPDSPTEARTVASRGAQRVLVVDDDEVALRIHHLHLTKRGFEVVLARGLEEARRVFADKSGTSFDCVLTDFEMPGGTGADLIDWLRDHDPTLSAIVVSAAGRKESVALSLRSGAADFLEKPVQLKTLEAALIRAIERTRRRRELVRIEKSAQEVGEIQRRTLLTQGAELPADTIVSHLPLSGAGGDFASVLNMPGGEMLVLLADVSGHDLRAAFISAYFQGMVRGMITMGSKPPQIFENFNRFLACEWIERGSLDEVPLSIALAAVTIDSRRGLLQMRGHGAPSAYLLRPDGWIYPCGTGGGCPLGWFDEPIGEDVSVALEEGGWLVLWTDGLEDLGGLLGLTPWTLAWDLLVAARSGNAVPERDRAEDDILLLSLPIGAHGALPENRPVLLGRYHGGESFDIDAIQAVWERSLRRAVPGLSKDRIADVLVCLREAVLNAIVHGCGRSSERSCVVQVQLAADGRSLSVRVDDPGQGHDFDWQAHAEISGEELLTEHRGLIFLHSMTDSFRTERRGATLVFEMAVNPDESQQPP